MYNRVVGSKEISHQVQNVEYLGNKTMEFGLNYLIAELLNVSEIWDDKINFR